MKTKTPNINPEKARYRTLQQLRKEFLQIRYDKNDPDRSEKLSTSIHEMANFVDRINKHSKHKPKNRNTPNKKK